MRDCTRPIPDRKVLPIVAHRRRNAALLTLTVAGVAGAGIGAVAVAATTTPNYNESVSCQVVQPVAVAGTRFELAKFFVAPGATKTGVLPVPTTLPQLPGVTITGWHLEYGSIGTSGGSTIGEIFAIVSGQQARQPIGQHLPGSSNEAFVTANATGANYSFFNHSTKPNAQITLAGYVDSATQTVTKVYAGTLCPAGTTQTATINPGGAADPTPIVTPSP
jgi:hypothetical protein